MDNKTLRNNVLLAETGGKFVAFIDFGGWGVSTHRDSKDEREEDLVKMLHSAISYILNSDQKESFKAAMERGEWCTNPEVLREPPKDVTGI